MKFKTILILVAVVLGVASGCETVCTDKTVGGKWVSSSCTSNGIEPMIVYQMDRAYAPAITDTLQLTAEDGHGSSTLELKGRELVQPINRFPYAIPEDEPTYVVEVTTNAACNTCEKGKVCINDSGCGKERHSLLADKMGEWAFACHGDKENCAWVYDLAESLNEAYRRRVK